MTVNMSDSIIVSLMDTIAEDYAAYIKGSTDKSLEEIFNRYWVLDDCVLADTFDNRLLKEELLEANPNFREPAFWTGMRLRSIKGSVVICTNSEEPFDFQNIGSLQKEINDYYKTLCNEKASDKTLEYKKEIFRPLTTLDRQEKFLIYRMGRMYQHFN